MEETWGLAALDMLAPTPTSAHPRVGGDPVAKITGDSTPLGSRLRGNDLVEGEMCIGHCRYE